MNTAKSLASLTEWSCIECITFYAKFRHVPIPLVKGESAKQINNKLNDILYISPNDLDSHMISWSV